jgi:hypothetical protein
MVSQRVFHCRYSTLSGAVLNSNSGSFADWSVPPEGFLFFDYRYISDVIMKTTVRMKQERLSRFLLAVLRMAIAAETVTFHSDAF